MDALLLVVATLLGICSAAVPTAHPLHHESFFQGILRGLGLAGGHAAGASSASSPVPQALSQIGASIGHAARTSSDLVSSLPGGTIAMILGLVGVPIFIAIVAFALADGPAEQKPPPSRRQQQLQQTLASHAAATSHSLASRFPTAVLAAPPSSQAVLGSSDAGAAYAHYTLSADALGHVMAQQNQVRGRLQTVDFPADLARGSSERQYTTASLFPSALPSLRVMSRPNTAGVVTPPQPPPQLSPQLHPSLLGGQEDSRVSPLSTALLVKNPAGVLVRFDGDLLPRPEQRTVHLINVKDESVILCAHVSETSVASTISVETKADSIPIAMLDSRNAVGQAGHRANGQKRVVLHQVAGDEPGLSGAPCAWVVPGGVGKFLVYYLPGDGEPAMTVHTKEGTAFIDRLTDPSGQIIARSAVMAEWPSALWVRQGADMALVACIAISVRKLGSGQGRAAEWTSNLLAGRSPSSALCS